MATLLIEYRVGDFAAWKAILDQDPRRRREHGATGHRILQQADDPNHLMLSLEFLPDQANGFLTLPAVRQVWERSGAGQAWVLRQTESMTCTHRETTSSGGGRTTQTT